MFSDGEEEGLDKNEEYINMQRVFYETQFLPYIKDEAERDCKFLSRFVECATGSCCLPYVAAGGSPVQIKVEFNLGVDALSYPSFHTVSLPFIFLKTMAHLHYTHICLYIVYQRDCSPR